MLVQLAELLALYIQSGPTLPEDRQRRLGSIEGFSHQLEPEQLVRQETVLPDPGELLGRGDGSGS